jgi:hypothetical protein
MRQLRWPDHSTNLRLTNFELTLISSSQRLEQLVFRSNSG